MAETGFVERLTPLDLVMPPGYVGALLVFPAAQPTPSSVVTNLQKSLDLVCDQIPWIKGKIFSTSTTDGSKSGLEIRWAATDTTLQIIDQGSISGAYEELAKSNIPPASIPTNVWPAPAQPGDGAPAFAASFFRFSDDKAVGLCVQGHHNAVDGFGFAEIVSLWARYMNKSGPEVSSINTSVGRDRILAKAINHTPNGAAPLSIDELLDKHPEYSKDPPSVPTEFSACDSEILSIPIDKIESLKQKLTPFLPMTPTTNTVACALIWSAITRTRIRRNPDLADKISRAPMAVNGRKRLDPGLADRQHPYLGNVVLFSFAGMPAGDVSASSQDGAIELLADVCRVIAEAQSQDRINAAHISEVYELYEKVKDHRSIFPGWELFGSRDLFITSWSDLDIYEQHFGDELGRPQFVRLPYAQGDGNVIVLPRKRDATSTTSSQRLEAVVMLQGEDLEMLKKDPIWGLP